VFLPHEICKLEFVNSHLSSDLQLERLGKQQQVSVCIVAVELQTSVSKLEIHIYSIYNRTKQ
jgi:hypothetical protein